MDSPLERTGFEPLVPLEKKDDVFETTPMTPDPSPPRKSCEPSREGPAVRIPLLQRGVRISRSRTFRTRRRLKRRKLRRRQTGPVPGTGFDDRQGQVYRAPSQAGPGNDINVGSPGFQKAPTRGPASLVAIRALAGRCPAMASCRWSIFVTPRSSGTRNFAIEHDLARLSGVSLIRRETVMVSRWRPGRAARNRGRARHKFRPARAPDNVAAGRCFGRSCPPPFCRSAAVTISVGQVSAFSSPASRSSRVECRATNR